LTSMDRPSFKAAQQRSACSARQSMHPAAAAPTRRSRGIALAAAHMLVLAGRMFAPVGGHGIHGFGNAGEALVVFLVRQRSELRVAVEYFVLYRQGDDRTEELHEIGVLAEAGFPCPRAQVDAATEALAPAARRESRRAIVAVDFS